MKSFNVGVIGIGDISDKYIANLKQFDVVHLIACASRGWEKAQAFADQFGIPRAYACGQEVIDDPDVDIVLNLTLLLFMLSIILPPCVPGSISIQKSLLPPPSRRGVPLFPSPQKRASMWAVHRIPFWEDACRLVER